MAEAVGITGIRVEDPADVRPALGRALATPGPALVDAITARQELARGDINGRGDEIVELVETTCCAEPRARAVARMERSAMRGGPTGGVRPRISLRSIPATA